MPSPKDVYVAVVGMIFFTNPSFGGRFLTEEQALEE
jgi:hypothetical protein